MSVGEDQSECPLCMEPLELDDINFFPCTCGYQICRFCWHRIRTDENGLCPACRKAYPEDPAEFKPLTEDELQRIKKERRQKEAQRKQKAAENRKHLANVRVVQKNLVFVVGLSQRLADPEVLRKHEYFGKFGKIHKVVINQSTSYAGAQGPSASAYVTYNKPEDALKAIQVVNNIHVDGRTLKASLGTTKYCSHFLRGAQCPKLDCMYLHELGEEAASFTKEEMQQGKHQEYEQKLYELFMNSQNITTVTQSTTAPTTTTTPSTTTKTQSRKKASSPVLSPSPTDHTPPPHTTKEAWPSLQAGGSTSSSPITTAPSSNKPLPPPPERLTNGNPVPPHLGPGSHSQVVSKSETHNAQNRAPGYHRNLDSSGGGKPAVPSPELSPRGSSSGSNSPNMSGASSQSQYVNGRAAAGIPTLSTHQPLPKHTPSQSTYTGLSGSSNLAPPPGLVSAAMAAAVAARKLPFQSQADSMSLFSSTNGFPAIRNPIPPQQMLHPLHSTEDTLPSGAEIPDTIPVSTSTDWQAAFGFTSNPATETHDDDLGFDPWNESAKGLAEIIERESGSTNHHHHHLHHHHHHNPKTQYSHPLPHPHATPPSPSSSSPRQQEPVARGSSPGVRHPPGMPQLVSSMAQITHLLENRPKHLPPGFTPNHLGAMSNNQMSGPGSKIMGLMHFPSVPPNVPNHSAYGEVLNSGVSMGRREGHPHPHNDGMSGGKDWQEGLRALFPTINISFGASQANDDRRLHNRSTPAPHPNHQHNPPHKNWSSENHCGLDDRWDPAIVTSGNVADSHSEEPHWMASLQHLTEDSTAVHQSSPASQNHRMPGVPPMPFRNTIPSWPPQNLGGAPQPPPGFHTPQIRPHSQVTPEVQQIAEGFQ